MPELEHQKQSDSIKTLPVIVIGGVYEYRGEKVRVTQYHESSGNVAFTNIDRTPAALGRLSGGNMEAACLTGPLSMPCPTCGEMVRLNCAWDDSLYMHEKRHIMDRIMKPTTPQDGEGM